MAEQFSNNDEFLAEMARRRAASEQAADAPQAAPNGSQPARPKLVEETTEEKGLTGLFIRLHVAKNAQQANYVMYGILAVAVVVMLWNFLH